MTTDTAKPALVTECAPANDRYRVGTLHYTRRTLVILFVWLLFGDFCFQLLETVVPKLLPLQLRWAGASNMLIGILAGTLPAIINLLVNPFISVWSDRHRGRFGRRIPFLVMPAPLVVLSLVILAFAEPIARWAHGAMPSGWISPESMLLLVLAVGSVGFQFVNLFGATVFYYLINDVVPGPFMGRFYGLFRIVASVKGVLFNWYIFGFADTHLRAIYVGVGLLYLVAFGLMCWHVREGQYPPPAPRNTRGGPLAPMIQYARECFTTPFFVMLYLAVHLYTAGNVGLLTFGVFLGQKMGMDLKDWGSLMGWGLLVGVVLNYPMGVLADRIHPLRLLMLGLGWVMAANIVAFFFVHDKWSLQVMWIVYIIGAITQASAQNPLFPALLPRTRFGQFASAASIVSAAALALGASTAGLLSDLAGSYQVIYLWSSAMSLGSLLCAAWLYRRWSTSPAVANE